MLTTEYKNKLAMEIADNPEPFFEKLLPKVTVERSGDTIRIQPCPKCGHRDCCNLTEGSPLINCFHAGCDLKGNIGDALSRIPEVTEGKISSIASEIFGIEVPNGRLFRQQVIKAMAVEHFSAELMKSDAPLTHQLEERGHRLDALKQFMVGLVLNLWMLLGTLREKGFSEEEIEEAKIKIPEGLFVYPYYDKTVNIVRFNTKGIPDESGNKPRGYSSGLKACYTTPRISKDKVIIVEGENDLISLFEAGETSVIALGGNPSREQLLELASLVDDVALVYLMFDNDDAGKKYMEEVNVVLPHKMVYVVTYEGKDPDDLLKRSGFNGSMEELIQSATLLPSEGYYFRHNVKQCHMQTREFDMSVRRIKREKDGDFRGDIEIQTTSGIKEFKPNAIVSRFKLKGIPAEVGYCMHKELCARYDIRILDDDLQGLIDGFYLSFRKTEIVSRMAALIQKSGTSERDASIIAEALGVSVRDQVLVLINEIGNKKLDLNKSIPRIRLAQYFNMTNNEAYFYFTRVVYEGDGIVMNPYMLSNKKELIRLDLIKRKNPKTLLLMNGKYQLPFEVESAIGDIQETSMQQHWVDKYVAGEIDEEMVKPDLLIRILERQIPRFFHFSDERVYKLLALWIFGTYVYELFGEFPYLLLNGKKGSGKSTIDNVIYAYAFNAQLIVNITEAALFRTISAVGGTMILDEMENISNGSKNNDSGLASVLKGGYSKSAGSTLRCDPNDYSIQQKFDVYGPKVISNINGVDGVIYDRVLEIQFPTVDVDGLSFEDITDYRKECIGDIREITSLCCVSALENFKLIHEAYKNTHFKGSTARMGQIMRPLRALAGIAGTDYVKALEGYYTEKIAPSKKDVDDATPHGSLEGILVELSLELLGRKPFELCETFVDPDMPDKQIVLHKDGFTLSQFWLWLALKTLMFRIDEPKNIHKWVKVVMASKPEYGVPDRTTVTWKAPDYMRESGGKYSVRNYRFYFSRFVPDWKPVEVVKELPTKVSGINSFMRNLEAVKESGEVVEPAPVNLADFF